MFESVAVVAGTDPAALAAALFAVTDEDIAALTVWEAEALTLAAERVMSAVAARQRSAIETVARRCDEQCDRDASDAVAAGLRSHHLSGHQIAAASLAPLLHVSPRSMATRVDQARRVVCALPQLQALAWAGELEPYRVNAVVRESYAASPGRLHEFEARLLEGGIADLSCAALRRRARRCADRCTPVDAGQAFEQARARRDVRVQPGDCTGMLADLIEANATIHTTIELVVPAERQAPGSLSGFGPAASADCLSPRAADETRGSDITGSGAGWFVDVGGCEELDDGILHDHGGDLWFVSSHCEVPALGSLLPSDIVALLADPDITVRLARSDPDTGAVRWQDPSTYRPRAQTARAVRSRDGTCRFPGCATAARRCQLDHVIPHPDGPTAVSNLQSLCATHHAFKHHAGWRVEMDPLGVCTWNAPDGRNHTTWPLDRHGYARAA